MGWAIQVMEVGNPRVGFSAKRMDVDEEEKALSV